MQLALVFYFHTRHMHHTPDLWLSLMVAQEHGEQLPHIQPVGLCPPRPPIDFDAGRIHHHVLAPLRGQIAMQPEAVSSRFIATLHDGLLLQAKPLFGKPDFIAQTSQISASYAPQPRRLPKAYREAQLPFLP